MLPGDSQHDSDDLLYNYFGSLTMLLTLVTAINNGGKPVLQLDAPAYHGALETSQPTSDVVLNAVAAILVRNNEIIAATAQDTHIVALHDDDSTPDSDRVHNQENVDIAMNQGVPHRDMRFRNLSGFSAIPNTRYDECDNRCDDSFCVLNSGHPKSHWSSCRGEWGCLDIR